MIKAVIFDYGGVISEPQHKDLFYPWAIRATGLTEEQFHQGFKKYRVPFDRGDFSGEEMYKRILDDEGRPSNPALLKELLERDFHSWSFMNMKTFQWAKELKNKGYKIGILTNMSIPFLPYFNHGSIRFRGLADAEIISAAVRLAKPGPEIYLKILDLLKVKPEESFFWDDSPVNIDAAHKLGMRAEVFHTVEQAREVFAKL